MRKGEIGSWLLIPYVPKMKLKAIGFDLFGTLLQAKGDQATCLKNMHDSLCERGITISMDEFLETYREVHADYRAIRRGINREFSNRMELSEVLRRFGYHVDVDSSPIPEAVSAYFSGWEVTVLEGVEATLQSLRGGFRTGIVTNFTDPAFIYKSLKDLNLLGLSDRVVVSAEVGWRKPNPVIFNTFLRLIEAGADEALFVGDDANDDVAGAKAVGMKTVLVAGESYNREARYVVQPDFIISHMKQLSAVVDEARRK